MTSSDFRVTLLGTGVPIPSSDRFGPCTLVEAGEQKFLIDAGRGSVVRRTRPRSSNSLKRLLSTLALIPGRSSFRFENLRGDEMSSARTRIAHLSPMSSTARANSAVAGRRPGPTVVRGDWDIA